jgi:ParB family chromosome partitioning protein
MRHDAHYVDELAATSRAIGKIISIDKIEPNPEQPRTEFGDLSELAASIKEKGVLEPLLVKPNGINGKYMIIAGERRWRASNLAGLTEVPCIEMEIDDQGIAEIALIENLQRKDLNVWEEADGLKALADKFGYTQEQIAQKISKSRSTVTEFMTIAGIPADIREKCRSANIESKGTLLEIARQFDEPAMERFAELLIGGRIKGDEIKKLARADRTVSHNSHKKKTNSFIYSGSNGDFKLKIEFSGSFDASSSNVQAALNEALGSVMNVRSGR